MAFADKFLVDRSESCEQQRRLNGRFFLLVALPLPPVVALLLLLDLGRPEMTAKAGIPEQRLHAVTAIKKKAGTTRIAGWVFKHRQSRTFHGEMDRVSVLLCQQRTCFRLPTHFRRVKRPLPQYSKKKKLSTALFSAGLLNSFLPAGRWQLYLQLVHNGRTTLTATDETITVD